MGALASFLVWVLQVFWRFSPSFNDLIPDLLAVQARPWLIMAAIILAALALWLAGHEERIVNPVP
jgi:hypothetical protein